MAVFAVVALVIAGCFPAGFLGDDFGNRPLQIANDRSTDIVVRLSVSDSGGSTFVYMYAIRPTVVCELDVGSTGLWTLEVRGDHGQLIGSVRHPITYPSVVHVDEEGVGEPVAGSVAGPTVASRVSGICGAGTATPTEFPASPTPGPPSGL